MDVQSHVLILPGLGGSGPDHWQSRWEAVHGYARVEQRDWETPVRADWLAALDAALSRRPGPFLLVAHSLACALVAQHARAGGQMLARVAGALLVAPADVDDPERTPDCTRVFAPLPLARLPYPCTVVASASDPYADIARAELFAQCWGAAFENVGDAGHINAESNLGDWPAGHRYLIELAARI